MRDTIPPAVEHAVLTALQKLPADRFESAHAFAEALGNPVFTGPGTSTTVLHATHGATSRWRRSLAAPAALGAVLLAAALWGWLRPTPTAVTSRQRVVLWQHPMGNFLSPGVERLATQAAIAPDGSSIVFSDSIGGVIQLMRKLRDGRDPVPVAGTEGGVSPFFSPDGAWIGFITVDGKLRKVPAAGGGAVTLASPTNPVYAAAAWLDDGTILYVDDSAGVRRVPADGGASTVVVASGATQRRSSPALSPLPGSRGFLYTACPGNCGVESAVYVYDFAADSGRLLVDNAAGAWYAPTGHLLYTDRAGGLYAAGFDLSRLELTSGAVPVIEDVAPATFALSASGSALYSVGAVGRTPSNLVWVSRDGSVEPLDSTWRGDFEYPTLSPDGQALAVSLREESTQLWIWRADGTRQKLTQDGTVNWRPSWTPDGQAVAFISNKGGGKGQDDYFIYRMRVDGSAPSELLRRHTFGLWEAELSRDGRWLVLRADEAGHNANMYAQRLDGDSALIPLLTDMNLSMQAALSPDGRWLAYASNPTGRRDIYVASFPDMKSIRLVSRDGGTEPRWAPNGRELFYKGGSHLMAVDVTPGPTFVSGVPRRLFPLGGYRSARNRQQYDVSPDGRRFVMIQSPPDTSRSDVVYVENWFDELRAKVKR
jgi:serine/threonine-protein kinase